MHTIEKIAYILATALCAALSLPFALEGSIGPHYSVALAIMAAGFAVGSALLGPFDPLAPRPGAAPRHHGDA
ncbi:MAG: hypothetical protein JRI25_29125 [Deltaproteobacteria bacterium]|nr:hypothetical protein [Deltaproteobacteria bacterium]